MQIITRSGRHVHLSVMDAQLEIQGEFWHVATVDAPSREETLAAAFINEAGANRLQPAA